MRLNLFSVTGALAVLATRAIAKTCTLQPLGDGQDDTHQVETAIQACGHGGRTVFEEGTYNITRKMTWSLANARVDLKGYLSFQPNVEYWLDTNSTYRVVFIQSQASWFVVTGHDFYIDAQTGGIQGNGQPWWTYFQSHTKADGDGRPISLTLWRATRGIVKNFGILSPPFWANTIAESSHITYDGMYVNATNTDPKYAGQNVVPNTDGINTYRSDHITLNNWDVTCGDDCLAVKGNSTNILAQNYTCRGGNGVAIGSLGQYANLSDIVANVTLKDLYITRIDTSVQPNMANGVYFKTWSGIANGSPPTGGGGGTGSVNNVSVIGVTLSRVNHPLLIYQSTDGGQPSTLGFSNLTFSDWSGVSSTTAIVNLGCSSAAKCSGITFNNFEVTGPTNQTLQYVCKNVNGLTGLSVPCK